MARVLNTRSHAFVFVIIYIICYTNFFDHTPTRELYTFPTRRSSDLFSTVALLPSIIRRYSPACNSALPSLADCARLMRSEEHTSELQSLRQLVCRLLLEKKRRVPQLR